MASSDNSLDLIVLVPGKDDEVTMTTLLRERTTDMGVSSVEAEVLVHPERDPGCFRSSEALLRPYLSKASFALVVFDHHGSGQERKAATDVAAEVQGRLESSGWEGRCHVVVVEPELETWLWKDARKLAGVLRCEDVDLREWLRERGHWPTSAVKPPDPKGALRLARGEFRIRVSSAHFRAHAKAVSFEDCRDPAFQLLLTTLRQWFPR